MLGPGRPGNPCCGTTGLWTKGISRVAARETTHTLCALDFRPTFVGEATKGEARVTEAPASTRPSTALYSSLGAGGPHDCTHLTEENTEVLGLGQVPLEEG